MQSSSSSPHLVVLASLGRVPSYPSSCGRRLATPSKVSAYALRVTKRLPAEHTHTSKYPPLADWAWGPKVFALVHRCRDGELTRPAAHESTAREGQGACGVVSIHRDERQRNVGKGRIYSRRWGIPFATCGRSSFTHTQSAVICTISHLILPFNLPVRYSPPHTLGERHQRL